MVDVFISSLIVVLIIQIAFFLVAASLKTDKVTDLSYGLTFILLSFYLLFSTSQINLPMLINTFLIMIWGIRLSGYLFLRILKIKKDSRFDGVRENPLKFAQFWLFQAIAVWIIMWPSIISYTKNQTNLSTLSYLGIFIWFVGLLIESIADQQKFVFKSSSENNGKWIATGIWKYSRHPNYFGEMLVWWGIFLLVVSNLEGIEWISVAGPIFITFILLFVSGIPPLEKRYNQKYKDNPVYQEYKSKTSLLIPFPPKT